uniref:Uncharacterized protein n=1 Tax=Lates calcarifer TaxID=8187 RepID=A0A4W6CJG7_LATCA
MAVTCKSSGRHKSLFITTMQNRNLNFNLTDKVWNVIPPLITDVAWKCVTAVSHDSAVRCCEELKC